MRWSRSVERDLEQSMERLASGKRINSASDDAAGMAVAAKMGADIRSLTQAIRNTNDAISLVNTYDGAAAEIESILIRMRELAVQSKTGTYEDPDRTNANYEYEALKAEVQRINSVTAFNRGVIASTGGANSHSIFVGSDVAKTGNSVTFSAHTLDLNASGATGSDVPTSITSSALKSIGTADAASTAVAAIDTAIGKLNANRAQAGALINRLEHTVANLMNVNQRLQEAVSGIVDADYAAESANLARGMVLQQAGTAMLAQANQAPQYVLLLLRA
ncbi:MAG: flagellin FliC [Acidibacter sp.]|nr:flagellin FliC [Acidibacter sp.]